MDGLIALAELSEINVSEEGVSGAKNFFEAKVSCLAWHEHYRPPSRTPKYALRRFGNQRDLQVHAS